MFDRFDSPPLFHSTADIVFLVLGTLLLVWAVTERVRARS